jgi:hypothetical protein
MIQITESGNLAKIMKAENLMGLLRFHPFPTGEADESYLPALRSSMPLPLDQ